MPVKGDLSGIFVNCDNCGKEVYFTKSRYNRAKNHFCSTKCQKEFNHKLLFEDRKCEICGKEFHCSKKSTQRFCSIQCQKEWQKSRVGDLNPRFEGIHLKCDNCNKDILVKKWELKKFKHHFCSDDCRRIWYANIFSQSDYWKETSRKRAVNILKNNKTTTLTKPQIMINELLDKMKINYINEKGYDYYSVDNYLNDYDLIIEVMGDYWHGSPIKYSLDKLNKVQRKAIRRDKAKHTYIKQYYNIEILYLWESDIYNNIDVCMKLINLYIKNNGVLENYNSFNYYINDNDLILKNSITKTYQQTNYSDS